MPNRNESQLNEAPKQLRFPDLIDIPTFARMLGVTPRYVRRLITENRVAYVKLGHFIRFDLAEVTQWIDKCRRNSSGEVA